MLVNSRRILREAYENRYAVGAFNAYSHDTIMGIVDAADKLRQPVIVAFGAKYLKNMTLNQVAALLGCVSEEKDIPICLHLDHCKDKATIYAAIKAGFSSVMYDGSDLPFEQNIANTARVCEVAHACGVTVEAELGSLAAGDSSHEGSAEDIEAYTDPTAARQFIERTGVDSLAVSIGTVHGLYKGTPNIRVDILKAIEAKAGIPLVLHGGSGTPEDVIAQCIDNGISKINVNTEVSSSVVANTKGLLGESSPHLADLSFRQREWVGGVVEKYMRMFKSI